MGIISWVKGLFAEEPVVDTPVTSVPTTQTKSGSSKVEILATTAATSKEETPEDIAPAKRSRKLKEKKKEVKEVKPAEKPKKAKQRRVRKGKVVEIPSEPEIVEEVTIEEIGENYADETKIESDDETKSTKKDE